MRTFRILKPVWAGGLLALVVLVTAFTMQGCTNLDEETFGVITPDQFFKTEGEVIAALAPVYAQLRAMMWSYHNISQHTSDETMVPVRGTDWDDGGAWRQLHQHTWDPISADWNGAWVDAFTGVARANVVLDNLENADVPNKAGIAAELRFLRAFYYFQLMDLFGGVPIVEEPAVDPDNPPSRASRAEVFNYIESELKAIRTDLPERWEANNFGRATRGAVDALLAKMYLNAEVFTGTVSASGLQKGTPRWDDAIAAVDNILNSGQYQLAPDYLDNFRVNNHTSPEIIFSVGHLAKGGLGFNFAMRALHYNQIPQTPWNGFMTLAEVYNSFDDADHRKDVFLVGQMYAEPNQGCIGNECFSQGDPLQDRLGNPLVFTPELYDPNGNQITGNPIGADENSGVRVLKWEIDPARVGGDNGNEYAFFRLAEMYLIKAEALNELGRTPEAVDLVNLVRARDNNPAPPISAGSQQEFRDLILLERRFELLWEATRRQDLIRHGMFTEATEFRQPSAPYRILGPIPQLQIDANQMLTQNPGY